MLGGGLEPPCLSAYAPQTYVSAISPPERSGRKIESGKRESKIANLRNVLPLPLPLNLHLGCRRSSEEGAEDSQMKGPRFALRLRQ